MDLSTNYIRVLPVESLLNDWVHELMTELPIHTPFHRDAVFQVTASSFCFLLTNESRENAVLLPCSTEEKTEPVEVTCIPFWGII